MPPPPPSRVVVRTTRPSRSAIDHVGDRRQLRIVRHQHQRRPARAVDVEQQLDDRLPGGAVEIAGRLVGEQDRRIVGERPRDRDALLLAARELRRVVMAAIGQTDFVEQLLRARPAAFGTPAISIGTSTFSSAVSDGSRWKNWKTKPMRVPRSRASASSSSVVMSTPSRTTLARRRRVEAGEQAEQRRLAAARRPGDRHDPPGCRWSGRADAGW